MHTIHIALWSVYRSVQTKLPKTGITVTECLALHFPLSKLQLTRESEKNEE